MLVIKLYGFEKADCENCPFGKVKNTTSWACDLEILKYMSGSDECPLIEEESV